MADQTLPVVVPENLKVVSDDDLDNAQEDLKTPQAALATEPDRERRQRPGSPPGPAATTSASTPSPGRADGPRPGRRGRGPPAGEGPRRGPGRGPVRRRGHRRPGAPWSTGRERHPAPRPSTPRTSPPRPPGAPSPRWRRWGSSSPTGCDADQAAGTGHQRAGRRGDPDPAPRPAPRAAPGRHRRRRHPRVTPAARTCITLDDLVTRRAEARQGDADHPRRRQCPRRRSSPPSATSTSTSSTSATRPRRSATSSTELRDRGPPRRRCWPGVAGAPPPRSATTSSTSPTPRRPGRPPHRGRHPRRHPVPGLAVAGRRDRTRGGSGAFGGFSTTYASTRCRSCGPRPTTWPRSPAARTSRRSGCRARRFAENRLECYGYQVTAGNLTDDA